MIPSTDFAQAALRYARLGLAVIPLRQRDKRPMFDNWPEVATADQSTIAKWWQQTPEANVGIATGQKSRVFVLDVDIAHGGEDSFDQLTTKHGRMPDTWQQITGSGGFHMFFRYPNFRVGNRAGLLPGIDIRGDGGQVVAPPSIHPATGKRYEWDGLKEIEQTPIADAPAWLLEILSEKTLQAHSDKFPLSIRIPKGVQHETLVAMAGMMRRLGLTPDEIYPSLMEVNSRRCTDPGPAENIRKIADSMMRYRPQDKDLYSTATKLWRMTAAKEHDAERERQKLQVEMVDGLTVYRSPVAEQAWVIDGILPAGLTMFAGRPKIGKSWLTLQMALSVAHGEKFLGGLDVSMPGGVLYVALEESQRRTSNRMHKLCDTETPFLQNISMVYEMKPLRAGGAAQLTELIAKATPSLVIIDTLLAFVKGSSGEKKDVMRSEYEEIDTLHKIAESQNVAIVLVHHMRKPNGVGGSVIDAIGGSTGITAAVDAVWGMEKQEDGMCTLSVLGREVEEQSLALRFKQQGDGVGWDLVGTGEAVKTMAMEKEIMKVLMAEGALTAAKISTLLRLNANAVRGVLMNMQQQGQVVKQSSGNFILSADFSRMQ